MKELARQPQVEARSVHEVFVSTPADLSLLANIRTPEIPAEASSSLDITHWQSSRTAMVLCVVFGTFLAVSHHFFYQHLNGTMVKSKNSQEWALRLGNAFALATKTILVAAVGIAYTQHVWTAFRKKAFSVEGIDAVIAVPNDVWAFLNRDVWLKCFTGTLIAGLLWYVTCLFRLGYIRLAFTVQPRQIFVRR